MRKIGQHPSTRIMQFLHAHPWKSAREISAALGLHLWTVNSTLSRLFKLDAVIREQRGRFIESERLAGYVRHCICYAIAPIEIKAELDSTVSLVPLHERVYQVMKENGGWMSISELINEIPGNEMNTMNNALNTLIRRGVVQKDREWRWVRVQYPRSKKREQLRHVELNIFSLKEAK